MIPINVPIVDSFTTLTPIDSFEFIPPQLSDLWALVNQETGEVSDTSPLPLRINSDGVRFIVSIIKMPKVSYLRITFTTKMLFQNYFDGINAKNFKYCFLYVLEKTQLRIKYSDFVNDSIINDIDICVNRYASDQDFKGYYDKFKHYAGVRTFHAPAENSLGQKHLIGFQFTNRKDASVTNPFVKFYSKYYEMHDVKNSGFIANVIHHNFADLRRIEITIKNRRHLESVCKHEKINYPKNLNEFLLLLPSQISRLFSCVLSRYIPNNDNRQQIPISELEKSPFTPNLAFQLAMLNELLQNGYTFKQVVNLIDTFPFFDYGVKSRLKSKLAQGLKDFVKMRNIQNLKVTPTDAFFSRNSKELDSLISNKIP